MIGYDVNWYMIYFLINIHDRICGLINVFMKIILQFHGNIPELTVILQFQEFRVWKYRFFFVENVQGDLCICFNSKFIRLLGFLVLLWIFSIEISVIQFKIKIKPIIHLKIIYGHLLKQFSHTFESLRKKSWPNLYFILIYW